MKTFMKRSEPSTSRDEQNKSKRHTKYSESYLKWWSSVRNEAAMLCAMKCYPLKAFEINSAFGNKL
jgi:hypothetical protein